MGWLNSDFICDFQFHMRRMRTLYLKSIGKNPCETSHFKALASLMIWCDQLAQAPEIQLTERCSISSEFLCKDIKVLSVC